MKLPDRLRGVAGPIALAIVADTALETFLQPSGPTLDVRLLSLALRTALALAVGWWLGTRVWPKRGRRLTLRLLRRMLRAKNKPLLFLTDRPDQSPSMGRRVFEVVAFSAGLSVILTGVLPLFRVGAAFVLIFGGLLVLATVWAAFTLVPYWMASRMGLRVVDPIRWTVIPVAQRYAQRLRLSNGALLLVALGVVVNLAVRAGYSQDQALVHAVARVLSIVTSILVIAATAVACYSAREHALAKEMEAEAVAAGVHDGRGMSDGDFLPRLRT